MAYSKELHRKAERVLERRREKALMEAEGRAQKIRAQLPEVDEIQRQLAAVGLEISQLFFYRGDLEEKLEAMQTESKSLVQKRNQILRANGFSENAMQPLFSCAVCEDKGFVEGRMCNCHREVLKELMRKEVSTFAPLECCTFENFRIDCYPRSPQKNGVVPCERAEKILEGCRQYAQRFSPHAKNLLFLGATGLGKTHLSLAIANAVINRGYAVCYGTSHNICEDLRNESFGREEFTYSKNQVLNCDLLILDDLGTETNTPFNIATIYNIINTRILQKRPMIISTNFEVDELMEQYDQRITSRILGEFTQMQLFGNDIRHML